jgi:hypothetical protein
MLSNVKTSSCKVPVILVRFLIKLEFSLQTSEKKLKYQMSSKHVQWVSGCCMRTHGRTDMTKLSLFAILRTRLEMYAAHLESLSTRWFKYDRDKLWLVYTQIVPVIFEPPCTFRIYFCRFDACGWNITGILHKAQDACPGSYPGSVSWGLR